MTTQQPAPVKGMKFVHAKRTDYKGDPIVGTVSSVSQAKEMVYWVHPLYQDRRIKMPLYLWEALCAEVVEMPEAKSKSRPRS